MISVAFRFPLPRQVLSVLINFCLEGFAVIFERDYHHCDVVEGLHCDGLLQDGFDGASAVGMDGLPSVSEGLFRSLPRRLYDLSVRQLVEDAIAAKDNEIVIVLDLKAFNVWSRDNDFRVALVLGSFRLDVAESSRH